MAKKETKTAFDVMLHPSEVAQIESWCDRQPRDADKWRTGKPSRSEAIAYLVQLGLEAEKARKRAA